MAKEKYVNSFSNNVGNTQIQQNSSNSSQSIIASSKIDYDAIAAVLDRIIKEADSFNLSETQKEDFHLLISESFRTIENKNAASIVKEKLVLVRDFLTQASATLAANGATALIVDIINNLPK